jgi:hypothetical protein
MDECWILINRLLLPHNSEFLVSNYNYNYNSLIPARIADKLFEIVGSDSEILVKSPQVGKIMLRQSSSNIFLADFSGVLTILEMSS